MDFFDVVHNRYSYKGLYAPTPVPMADLEKIAAAALTAPTGANTQCVSLIILDRKALDALDAVAHTNGFSTAPAAIAVFVDPELHRPGRNSFPDRKSTRLNSSH